MQIERPIFFFSGQGYVLEREEQSQLSSNDCLKKKSVIDRISGEIHSFAWRLPKFRPAEIPALKQFLLLAAWIFGVCFIVVRRCGRRGNDFTRADNLADCGEVSLHWHYNSLSNHK